MKEQRVSSAYLISCLIWLSVCLFLSIKISSPLILQIVRAIGAIAIFIFGIYVARKREKVRSFERMPTIMIVFTVVAVLELILWKMEESRLAPSNGSVVYLITGLGLIALTVVALIIQKYFRTQSESN